MAGQDWVKILNHQVIHEPTLARDQNGKPVMPAWTAGIQIRKDASRDIHVNLDSRTPCWNDSIESFWLD